MKLTLITRVSLCALAVTGLVSCSGSGDTSSTTNSGSAVVGAISGFGSIIMDNGVEYETDGLSSCEVDDQTVAGVCEDSLSTGMHVTLQTDSNGVVTSLKYDDELEGVATNVSGTNGSYTFEVFGVTIITNNPETQWDDFSTAPPTAVELNDENVEVSGEWQQDGTLIASYIEKQSDSSHEVEGTVGVVTVDDFPLTLRNGSTIDVDGSALGQLPTEGEFVELEGSYDSNTSVFTAIEMEIEDKDDFDSDSEVEITGTLTANAESSTGFSIGNTDVDISNASSCSGLTGLFVEAEGTFNQDTGVLVVDECEDEDEDMEAKCQVSNATIIDIEKPKVGTVECGFPGTTGGSLSITFKDTPDLAMFSGDSTLNTFDLTNVSAGDCVELKFSKDANGDYIAGLIEHEGSGQCESYELEATVDGFNDGIDITALGITFTVNPTTIYDPSGSNASLNIGDKVKIVDNDADGIVDKIEVD